MFAPAGACGRPVAPAIAAAVAEAFCCAATLFTRPQWELPLNSGALAHDNI